MNSNVKNPNANSHPHASNKNKRRQSNSLSKVSYASSSVKMVDCEWNLNVPPSNYPYVIVNTREFTDEFKRHVRNHTESLVEFGLMDREGGGGAYWRVDHPAPDR